MYLLLRYTVGAVFGVLATVLLLWIMQAVISSDKNPLNEAPNVRMIDFVRVLEDQEVQVKTNIPKPPPPPVPPPPDIPTQTDPTEVSMGTEFGLLAPSIDINLGKGGYDVDGEYLPIVKVEPQYPRRALSRGIEGEVMLSFCITENGSVIEPVVVSETPPGIFTRAAMNAALKFKYKPKVQNGVAIQICGVKHRLTFKMED